MLLWDPAFDLPVLLHIKSQELLVDNRIYLQTLPIPIFLPLQTILKTIEQGTRKGRQKAENRILRKHFKRGGQRPRIEIPLGKKIPLGDWSQQWITELGILCRKHIPLAAHSWKEVEKEERESLYKIILDKFDMDLDQMHVLYDVNDYLKVGFRDYRHDLHNHYLGIVEGLDKREYPAEDVAQHDWESLCLWFEDPKFLKRYAANKQNCKRNKVNHSGGSKSFVRHRHDQKNHETNEEPTRVEFYRSMRYNDTKGWIHPQAQENYEKMVHIPSQPQQEGSIAPTDDEIVDGVLGIKSGRDLSYNHSEVVQLRRRAEDAEQHLQELREEQVTQQHAMDALHQQVIAQQQQVVAQQQQMEE